MLSQTFTETLKALSDFAYLECLIRCNANLFFQNTLISFMYFLSQQIELLQWLI